MPPSSTLKGISAANVTLGLRDLTRWRILRLLMNELALPSGLISKRLGVEQSLLSKHLSVLKRVGMLEHTVGKLYGIPASFRIPGENALDFGSVVLRLDYAPA